MSHMLSLVWVFFLILGLCSYSEKTWAVQFQTDDIKVEGPGCSQFKVEVESNLQQKQLVLSFSQLQAEMSGSQKESLNYCQFSLPVISDKNQIVEFAEPQIEGSLVLAKKVEAMASFEMAWPGARGPNYHIGYKPNSQVISEIFRGVGQGTSLAFMCGEKTELVGSAIVQLKSGWFYKGGHSSLQTNEIRLDVIERPCSN